jgi:hypothetical protein
MADTNTAVEWPGERIPDQDRLFYRVHVGLLPDGNLHPGIFREQGSSMSADWEKYSTAQESRGRAKEPAKNGVIALIAGAIRSIDDLKVHHVPLAANRAHSIIKGMTIADGMAAKIQKTMVRVKLFERFNTWVIDPFS